MAFIHCACVWFVVVVAFAFISTVNGLNCYECGISNGQDCANPDPSLTINCNKSLITLFPNGETEESQHVCMKIVEQNSTSTYYTRFCALSSDVELCNRMASNSSTSDLTVKECSVCKTDYCNSSSLPLYNLYVIMLFILLRNCL